MAVSVRINRQLKKTNGPAVLKLELEEKGEASKGGSRSCFVKKKKIPTINQYFKENNASVTFGAGGHRV